MTFDSIPQEILEHVGFYLATDQLCGPPSSLVPFLLTNRRIHNRLSPLENPHFYALIFAHKFDVNTAKKRLGDDRVSSVTMTEELRRRFTVLRRIRSKKDCLADPSSIDQCTDDILATAYLMMLENEGRNKEQLLAYADIGQWIKDYLLHDKGASLTRQQLLNGGYPLPTTRAALAMWLFWFFMRPDQYGNKMSGLEIPLTVLKTLAFSAHLYDLTNIPWFEYSPSQPRQPSTVVTWYSQPMPLTPPPMAVPAILSFLALVNKRNTVPITPSDPSIPVGPVDEWGAEWGRAVSSGIKHNQVADCFNLGSIDGVWEGFFTYTEFTAYAAMLGGASPQQIQNSIIGRHQQTWKLREWHRVQSEGVDVEPLNIGDPLRSFFPEGTKMTETQGGLVARDPQSAVPILYHKPGAKRGKVVDVIITGEGHSAWGQFSLTGRVRPCDGFISLSKDYVDDDRGKWLYRGYLVGNANGNIVGRNVIVSRAAELLTRFKVALAHNPTTLNNAQPVTSALHDTGIDALSPPKAVLGCYHGGAHSLKDQTRIPMAANPVTTTEDIVQHADYHAKLLRTLSDLDYTPTALRQHREYIQDIDGQLAASNRKVEELSKATKKERKDHERLRDSTARRLAAKLSGKKEKYEAEQEKEEKEYVEALHNEMAERDNNAMLQQLLAEARVTEEELVNKGKTKESVEREIHSLYNRVFEGPSESFPEEDRLEYEVHEAHKQHERAQSSVNMESRAAELLSRSVQSMERCLASVKEALSYSRYDMWGGGGMADMMERNALTNATAHASQAESFAEQASRVNPVVQPVGRVQIAQGSLMSDVFFDNIFTDMAFHDKIKRSAAQVLLSLNRLKQERDAALQRADTAGRNIGQVHQRLEDKRKELFYLRKALFESVASTATRPPSYDKVTQATAAPRPPSGPTYAPPPGPPPAFRSREQLDKVGQSPPSFPEPQTGTAGTSAMSSAGTNEARGGGPTAPEPNSPPSSPRPWGTRNPYAALLAERSRSMSNTSLQ